jgi:hypothetical protein
MSFKSVLDFHNQTLDQLRAQTTLQQDLLVTVRRLLPEDLSPHVQHCVIREHSLILYTDSAVWSSQLRFYSKVLLAGISSWRNYPIAQLKVKLIADQTIFSKTEK